MLIKEGQIQMEDIEIIKIKADWEVIITTVVVIQRICIQMESVHIQPKHHQNQNLQIKVQIQTSQKTINSTNSAIAKNEEKNEKNTTNNIVKSYENNEVNNNIEAKDEENISDVLAGFTTLGLMGGEGYIAYKKLKNK